jgi:hypothetical protein
MECREPLYIPAQKPLHPRNSPAPASSYHRQGGRYSSPGSTPQTPPPPPPQSSSSANAPIALPIPKNVVLLAMMEAAERQAKIDMEVGESDEDDDEEFDLNKIISSMATLSGPCGTYAVRESEGLVVLPYDPNRGGATVDEEKKMDDPGREEKEPISLKRGQQLQVVDFQDGVAKLARGDGYVVASSSQLVKGTCLVV